ncbi:hypothetical protein E1264_33160 [Actinomadura sp. KC216]|uniref:hypothetical protein n=1 Tax=Actinomadura sp. KC216 TaxID=2530370 RepID=UPI001051CC2C|nr:hypothetical protein [Actinomadura sp. KC216]TDB81140.1 hypothetical protein E1264_33160 [Actinomadura sp. KC216]
MSVIVFGTLGYGLLGLACLTTGMRMRRGIGKYTISRKAKVDYAELPLTERIRASNALLILGTALLLCATFSIVPEPVMALTFLTTLFLFIFYLIVQRDLRRAAQEIARARAG